MNRREFGTLMGGAAAGLAASACGLDALSQYRGDGRLKSRPRSGVKTTAKSRSALGLGGARDGLLQLPAVVPSGPMPLLVLLHGASSSAERQLARFNTI